MRALPFNFLKWLTCNFSLYPCIIQQTGTKNTQTYLVEGDILIQHKVITNNLQEFRELGMAWW